MNFIRSIRDVEPGFVARVREACLEIENLREDLGPGLRRGVTVRPEFDCRLGCAYGSQDCRPGACGYHGHGARRLLFYISAPGRGGVAFDFYTPITVASYNPWHWYPTGSVDYHLMDPIEPTWMTRVRTSCDVTGEDYCWHDSIVLQADVGTRVLLQGGKEGVWSWLAESWLPAALARSK